MERRLHRKLISTTQQQYKLAVAVKGHCSVTDGNAFTYLDVFAYGPHTAEKAELELQPHQEEFAAAALEHSAIYIMAVQIDTALGDCFENRFNHLDLRVFNASWIARLIRNAFAHDPFNPVWLTYRECDNKIYAIKGVIALETTGKNNRDVKRLDYGGPLALLRFAEYVKTELLTDEAAKAPQQIAGKPAPLG